MSTNDVPGHRPENNDELAMGCWAEHKDGSLIFVDSVEGNRVIYSMFDMTNEIEYRDAIPEASFKTTFSWDPDDPAKEKWTWHDKTPFPWDRVIKQGASDGPRMPSAGHVMTAAERIARSLRLRGEELDRDNLDHRHDTVLGRIGGVLERLTDAIDRLDDRRSRR